MYIRNREAERLNYYRIPNPRIEDLQHGCYNIRAQIWNGGKHGISRAWKLPPLILSPVIGIYYRAPAGNLSADPAGRESSGSVIIDS